MPEHDKSKKQTEHLNLPADSNPMTERAPGPGTTMLSEGWNLSIRIEDQQISLPVTRQIVVGRIIDGEKDIDLDLTPFSAYHYGVSRRHAIITLNEGYLYLEDLGSTNSTRINGFQLTPKQKYRLRDGDEIEFGRLRTSVRFQRPGR